MDEIELQQADRLRNAFAQLLMQGQGGAAPVEKLWAAQGQQQGLNALARPQQGPGEVMDRSRAFGSATTDVPMRQFDIPEGAPNFPTAAMGPGSTQYKAQNPAKDAFPGALEKTVKPYELPKKNKKQKKGKSTGGPD